MLITPTWKLFPMSSQSLPISLSQPWQPLIYFLSLDLPLLDIYQRNQTVSGLLCLAAFAMFSGFSC